MNSSIVCSPRQPPLAQLGDARAHEVVVRAARAEAELRRDQRALDVGREARQLGQQRLVRTVVARDLAGQPRQCALDARDPRAFRARDGQREERQHPVRLDLEQPLQHAARLPRCQAAVDDDEARPAVVVDAEVRERESCAVADLPADDDVAIEVRGEPVRVGRPVRPAHQLRVRGDDRPSRDRGQPAVGQEALGRLAERLRARARHEERVARELGVPLPLDADRADAIAEVGGTGTGRRHAVRAAQRGQVFAFAVAVGGVDQDRDVGGPLRCRERRVRSRVHLVGQREAIGVVGGKAGHRGPMIPPASRGRHWTKGAERRTFWHTPAAAGDRAATLESP